MHLLLSLVLLAAPSPLAQADAAVARAVERPGTGDFKLVSGALDITEALRALPDDKARQTERRTRLLRLAKLVGLPGSRVDAAPRVAASIGGPPPPNPETRGAPAGRPAAPIRIHHARHHV